MFQVSTIVDGNIVAPLAGSVDRNAEMAGTLGDIGKVAPLAGSVDRNGGTIFDAGHQRGVAPLAGSVDRNLNISSETSFSLTSLPSRGAWIEIVTSFRRVEARPVAPLAGSVDRNMDFAMKNINNAKRRSPRGERG